MHVEATVGRFVNTRGGSNLKKSGCERQWPRVRMLMHHNVATRHQQGQVHFTAPRRCSHRHSLSMNNTQHLVDNARVGASG